MICDLRLTRLVIMLNIPSFVSQAVFTNNKSIGDCRITSHEILNNIDNKHLTKGPVFESQYHLTFFLVYIDILDRDRADVGYTYENQAPFVTGCCQNRNLFAPQSKRVHLSTILIQ